MYLGHVFEHLSYLIKPLSSGTDISLNMGISRKKRSHDIIGIPRQFIGLCPQAMNFRNLVFSSCRNYTTYKQGEEGDVEQGRACGPRRALWGVGLCPLDDAFQCSYP